MRNADGLSIIELLISISVIAIAFTALTYSQLLSFDLSRDSREVAQARDIATAHMEQIRGHGYGAYQDCPGTSPDTSIFIGAPACTGSQTAAVSANYTLSWTITNQAQNPYDLSTTLTLVPPPLVQVSITVAGFDVSYDLGSFLSCADAGDFSVTNVPCPSASMRP